MGAIGGVLRATSGPPQFSTVQSTKNQALQGSINAGIDQFKQSQGDINSAFNDYTGRYMAGEGAAAANTGQEVGAINQFYNGSMANQLSALRAQRSKAMTDAANVASQQAIRSQNRSRVAGQGGGSSYDTRLTMANLTPIRTQAALDDANQARTDLGYVTQSQLDLAGRRTALNTAQAGYGLVPQQQRLAALGQENSVMAGLGNADQQNNFYGLQKKPNMWADVADSLDAGVLNGLAAYSSVAGGMKRGGTVRGPGTETSDSIPVRLSKGEFVLPAEIMHMTGILPLVEKIRKIALKHREERLQYGHLADQKHFDAGMHPVHGKAMDEMHKDIKTGMDKLARGGMAKYSKGYADGGEISFGDMADNFDIEEGGGGGGMKKKGGGGGGGGGGLAGSAQQLNARAMEDLTPQWGGAVMIPQSAAPMQHASMPGRAPAAPEAPDVPQSDGGSGGRSQFFNPSNYSDISPKWQEWANQTAEFYNNPKSPGYIAPGTYE